MPEKLFLQYIQKAHPHYKTRKNFSSRNPCTHPFTTHIYHEFLLKNFFKQTSNETVDALALLLALTCSPYTLINFKQIPHLSRTQVHYQVQVYLISKQANFMVEIPFYCHCCMILLKVFAFAFRNST